MTGTSGGRATGSRLRSVATYAALAVAGALLVVAAIAYGLTDLAWGVVLAIYTVYAVVITAALAVGQAIRPRGAAQEPAPATTTIDGQPATGFRSWPGDWLWDLGLSAGLVVTFVVLAVLALLDDAAALGVVLLVPAAVSLATILLAAAGRRRPDAVWMTADHLALDSVNGRETSRLADVRAVRVTNGWVFVDVDGPIDRTTPPRPWRRPARERAKGPMIDPAPLDVEADVVAEWLRHRTTDRHHEAASAGGERPARGRWRLRRGGS